MKEYRLNTILVLTVLIIFSSCSPSEEKLTGDYIAPPELPSNVIPGNKLNDRIIKLYNDYGIIVYTDVNNSRMYSDLTSDEGLNMGATKRVAADTSAAIFYINMIEDEFIKTLPPDKLNLVPRNFYFFKNKLFSGSPPRSFVYLSKIWYNSNGDLSVGNLDNQLLDTVQLKQTFYYALSTILRSMPQNKEDFYRPFIDIKTDNATYYFQVSDIESAYDLGFTTDNQNLIRSDQQDFDLFAAWISVTPPATRDSLLNAHSILKEKYSLVSNMFIKAGIPLETIAKKWSSSPYNPKNN